MSSSNIKKEPNFGITKSLFSFEYIFSIVCFILLFIIQILKGTQYLYNPYINELNILFFCVSTIFQFIKINFGAGNNIFYNNSYFIWYFLLSLFMIIYFIYLTNLQNYMFFNKIIN